MLLQVGKLLTEGRTGWADVLEAGRSGQTGGRFQLSHQLPAVQGVQEVDETRASVQHLHGQLAAVAHEDAGRFLIGIATVFEFEFLHVALLF